MLSQVQITCANVHHRCGLLMFTCCICTVPCTAMLLWYAHNPNIFVHTQCKTADLTIMQLYMNCLHNPRTVLMSVTNLSFANLCHVQNPLMLHGFHVWLSLCPCMKLDLQCLVISHGWYGHNASSHSYASLQFMPVLSFVHRFQYVHA